MSAETTRGLIDDIFYKPDLSLTTVRWVTETEETDEDGDTYISEKEMFDVVGEQHRLGAVEAAAHAIAEENTFLPARFWLICDNDNEHDDQAVGVHSIVGKYAYHVGFLPKRQARLFRKSMASLDLEGLSLEVLGCIAKGKTTPYPNARLYLPIEFAELVNEGYTDDPENAPSWLSDASPVSPRPWQGRDAKGFTDDELRKIYCWYARKRMWNSLPNKCEEGAVGFRSCRASVPEPMEHFVLEPDAPNNGTGDWQDADHYDDAIAFARGLIRSHLKEVLRLEDTDAEFKHTSVGGRRGEPGCLSFTIYWQRVRVPVKSLATIKLTRIGPGATDFKIDNSSFNVH